MFQAPENKTVLSDVGSGSLAPAVFKCSREETSGEGKQSGKKKRKMATRRQHTPNAGVVLTVVTSQIFLD